MRGGERKKYVSVHRTFVHEVEASGSVGRESSGATEESKLEVRSEQMKGGKVVRVWEEEV